MTDDQMDARLRRAGEAWRAATDLPVRPPAMADSEPLPLVAPALLARTTGVFAETAGGVTVAVLKKLVETGQIDTSIDTVVYNTGDGLKTIDAISQGAHPTAVIPPTLKGMREAGLL